MSSNILKLKKPVQIATSMKVPSMQLESLTTFFNKSPSSSKVLSFKEKLYERAIGQHCFKNIAAHPNPTRFGDFEVKGRTSDF